jgi:hypothetical protein
MPQRSAEREVIFNGSWDQRIAKKEKPEISKEVLGPCETLHEHMQMTVTGAMMHDGHCI